MGGWGILRSRVEGESATPREDGREAPTACPRDRQPDVESIGATCDGIRPYAVIRRSLPRRHTVDLDGRCVHVEQRGRGEPVLLLHGFGCSSYSWRQVVPRLAREYRVVAPDLNGFGWSERPRRADAYTFEGQEELVFALAERLGLESFHVVGHSYGAGLGLWMAARHPRRVRSLTLLAAPVTEQSARLRQAWARFRSLNWLMVHFVVLGRAAIRRAMRAAFFDPELATPELVDAYRSRLLVEGVEDAYYGLLAPIEAPAPRVVLEEVATPTLALWGEHDRLFPFGEAEPRLRRLPNVELAVLERCGHAPMEECPAQVLSHLLPFLARHRFPWHERIAGRLRTMVRRAAAMAS